MRNKILVLSMEKYGLYFTTFLGQNCHGSLENASSVANPLLVKLEIGLELSQLQLKWVYQRVGRQKIEESKSNYERWILLLWV